jgi:acyl transferase domain-containing protein/thioesterase domain-containing protein/acyl carrier protein
VSSSDPDQAGGYQIAIIGMAGRFPGAPDVDSLWANVSQGVESVHFFSEEELIANGETPKNLADPDYVRAWPVLAGIDRFDASFFGMSPRDAAVMDPQHRLFLETAWAALENAGYEPEKTNGPVGVFAANGMNHYMLYHLVPNREVMETVGEWLVRHNGNDMNFLATRASYQMNLRGPSLNVQTACSSALVAVHLACQSLLTGECDYALVGASTLSLPQDRGYLYKEGEILSIDGHCRPFDAGSHGTLFGSGTGCVVLRRLSDAERDGDRVLAVIRGSAINNDGSQKVGYLAPSVDGQARVISEALAVSGTHPETIGYVEAHGTGTAVGDPIEVRALTDAFRAQTQRTQYCGIGSLKANIGHLGEAAGIASLIKTVLALQAKKLPPSINYERPNPEIDFPGSPFFVNTKLSDWPELAGAPRRAGVTALGAGGTNAHLILEAAPEAPPATPSAGPELFLLSARSDAAADRARERLAAHLENTPTISLADAAFTLQFGRKHFVHRRALVAKDAASAIEILRTQDPKRLFAGQAPAARASVAFMFPGGGAQYPGMGRDHYARGGAYKAALDECLSALEIGARTRVTRLLLESRADDAEAARELEKPSLALPALFATEYAMAALLASLGVEADALIGHSMGEYVAACLAGVFSTADGMGLVTRRGKLFETLPEGGMLSVALPEADARALIGNELSIAAVNARELCVVSGPVAAIEQFSRVLDTREIEWQRIHISVAAHSAMLEPILAEFSAYCAGIRFQRPTRRFVSNLTGTWIRPEEAMDPGYWVRHLRSTVRFDDGIKALLGQGTVLVEVGPGRTLASLARQQVPAPVAVTSLRHPRDATTDTAFLLETLGRLWVAGVSADFAKLHAAPRRRIELPSYAFEPQRHFIAAAAKIVAEDPLAFQPVKRKDVGEWFATSVWREKLSTSETLPRGPTLIFADRVGLAEKLKAALPDAIIVRPRLRYFKLPTGEYTIHPGSVADYQALFDDLALSKQLPSQIIHLFGVTTPPSNAFLTLRSDDYDHFETLCFKSLLFIAQSLETHEVVSQLDVVTSNLHSVTGETTPSPVKALVLGPVLVIPREMSAVATRNIDVRLGSSRRAEISRVAELLLPELLKRAEDRVVALRGQARFVKALEPVTLAAPEGLPQRIKRGGVYLISGGLGGIGLVLANHLARTAQAKLVLTGRTTLPVRREFPEWLRSHGPNDATSRKIAAILEIEAAGAEVLTLVADASDPASMHSVRGEILRHFGRIDGVIHAAGTLDDGLISLKTEESAQRVLRSKARSMLVLNETFQRDPLDFFVSFSSVSGVLGLEGQIDYSAANAVLDAFASSHRGRSGRLTQSIAWNAWQEVGMAVSTVEATRPSGRSDRGKPGPHPCLERIAEESADGVLYATSFTRVRHWLLGEHVVHQGAALIPGTGYLELARAGAAHFLGNSRLVIERVSFLSPFLVQAGQARELFVRLIRRENGVDISFYSDSEADPHALLQVGTLFELDTPLLDIAAVRARCDAKIVEVGGHIDQPFMDFGPRWANVRRIAYGNQEALIELGLSEDLLSDLASYELHPALLDMATGAAQAIVPGLDLTRDFLVPVRYSKLRLFGALTGEIVSHVRLAGKAGGDFVSFDVTIADPNGTALVAIDGFTMKRVDRQRFGHEQKAADEAPASMRGKSAAAQLVSVVSQGIAPAEGMDALFRLLAFERSGHFIASSIDVIKWLSFVDASTRRQLANQTAGGAIEEETDRAQLRTAFVAPQNEIELELCGLFQKLLGVSRVGIHDDFFELGGQSLVAVRLFNRIHKRYQVDLPLSTLFDAPTVAACAKLIASELGVVPASLEPPKTNGSSNGAAASAHATSVPEPIELSPPSYRNGESGPPASVRDGSSPAGHKRSGDRWRSLVVMQPKGDLPPFFCIAGMGGTLNNLRKLSLLAGESRPFIGLQPPGADGRTQLLYSVEALAEHYRAEIAKVQSEGPYLLGGYSGGGVAAFEVARQLTALGSEVIFLGFIDSFSPNLPKRGAFSRARIHYERVADQGPGYLLHTLERRLKHHDFSGGRWVKRNLGKLFPTQFRYENIADSWVVAESRYRPEPWTGSAVLFRAREESAVSLWTAVEVDSEHGWSRYVKGGVEVQIVPGNHGTMCEEPNVRVLADKLRQAMDLKSPPAPRSLRFDSAVPSSNRAARA